MGMQEIHVSHIDEKETTHLKIGVQAFIVASALLLLPTSLFARTYYVDSLRGSDANSGRSPKRAWKSLTKVNSAKYLPGDCILLRSGATWEGGLELTNSGRENNAIRVDRYGRGSLPRIDGNGLVENVLKIENVEHVEVRHLELTNHGVSPAKRRGVLVSVTDYGTAHHVVVSDLYIHDVNGTNEHKDTGGILIRTMGKTVKSRFDGLIIERNIIWRVDRSAISGDSNEVLRSKWYPSLNVIIRDNYAEDIGGDGIVPWATDGALVEHNIVLHCNKRAGSYNAGIWPWSTDNTLLRLNEAAYTHTSKDGEGFDSDFNSRNTQFLYNYSHDNDGGFMLICTPVKRDEAENVGNTGTIIRYNISRNDHERIFHLSGADQTTIEDNAIYVSLQDDVQIVLVSNWEGWSTGALFKNNKINVAGIGRYGYGAQRSIENGKYQIAPGWGGAKDIRFEGNRYFGRHFDRPEGNSAVGKSSYHPDDNRWKEPTFNPSHPELFSAYLERHRNWMLRLFYKEFKTEPKI
jgi:hypothetical protein